jgi:hypothetical protein
MEIPWVEFVSVRSLQAACSPGLTDSVVQPISLWWHGTRADALAVYNICENDHSGHRIHGYRDLPGEAAQAADAVGG